jgi:hypothetical protein
MKSPAIPATLTRATLLAQEPPTGLLGPEQEAFFVGKDLVYPTPTSCSHWQINGIEENPMCAVAPDDQTVEVTLHVGLVVLSAQFVLLGNASGSPGPGTHLIMVLGL